MTRLHRWIVERLLFTGRIRIHALVCRLANRGGGPALDRALYDPQRPPRCLP